LDINGKYVVGGDFTTFGLVSRQRIVRLSSTGGVDSSFDPMGGFNGIVRAIAVQPDGRVVVGGFFTAFNGFPRNHIARLNSNGSLDTSFNPGVGSNGNVFSVGLQPDGKIIIGGSFSSYNGVARANLARLHPDGSLDLAFGPTPSSIVRTLSVLPTGKLMTGGGVSPSAPGG